MGRKKLVSDEQLLETARAVFAEQGLKASTREIARRAEVSEGVIFQRYATKTDLFLAAMVPPEFDLKACLPADAAGFAGERAIREIFLAMLGYFRGAAPIIVQMLANQDFDFEKFADAHPGNSLASLRWALVEVLQELKAAGKTGGDPAYGALALFTVANSLVLFERFGAHGGRFSDAMLDGLLSMLWQGFGPRPGSQ